MSSRYSSRYVCSALLALLVATLLAVPIASASGTWVRYRTLASFDFLSVDEVGVFENVTLSGSLWNTSLTSYSVSGGKLNISNTDTVDVFLVYPVTLNGYAEITLDCGVIGVFTNYNGTTVLTGYEIVKDSNGIIVYLVNGTSKTAVASLTTTANTVIVTVMDGKFRVDLSDGTGVYEGSITDAVLALGAPASDGSTTTYGVFDKIVIYGVYLSGTHEIDLGTKTVTPSNRVAEFRYDVSGYRVRSAKLVVKMMSRNDIYARYFIISTEHPGQVFWKTWPEHIKRGVVIHALSISVDVTSIVRSRPRGSFFVGISTFTGSWSVSARLVIEGERVAKTATTGSTGGAVEVVESGGAVKYLAVGVGAVALLALVLALVSGGRRSRRGLAAVVAALVFVLVVGAIAVAVLAWLHPEYLTALAMGLGAIALVALLLMITSGRRIPNPFSPS